MRIWGNGIEPVDQIYEYCRAYKLNRDIQTAILNDACRPNLYPGIKCTRGEALVYTKDVQVQIKSNCTCTWNSTTNTTLIVPLTEEEETSLPLEPEFKNIWAQKNISEQPIIVTRTIRIYQSMQAADVIEEFRRKYNDTLNYTQRNNMIVAACNDEKITSSWDTQCSRYIPRLIEQPLNMPPSHGGHFVGVLSIFEPGKHHFPGTKEEVVDEIADQILEFCRNSGVASQIRRNIVHNMCYERVQLRNQTNNQSMCSRGYSLLMNSSIRLDIDVPGYTSGAPIGPIAIYGHQEPCDQIDAWTYANGYSYAVRDALIAGICNHPAVQSDCGRTTVSHWSVNVESQIVEFLEGKEAVDLLFAAFRSSGQMQWQRDRVLDIACSQPRMICDRREKGLLAVTNVTFNSTETGIQTLYLWEHGSVNSEMIDMIYDFGVRNGMDYRQRWKLSRNLCNRYRGRCSRSVAIVGWIPVNRDENITCPKSIYDRPYDNNDLLKLFFEKQKEKSKDVRNTIEKYRKKMKDTLLHQSLKFLETEIFFEWNRTRMFGNSIHGNESHPIAWLIVDFDRYFAIPYMLVLGWLPMVILTTGCGLKWVRGTGRGVDGEDGEDG